MKTFAIAGCGHLGNIVKKAYENGLLKGYSLAAVYSLRKEDAGKSRLGQVQQLRLPCQKVPAHNGFHMEGLVVGVFQQRHGESHIALPDHDGAHLPEIVRHVLHAELQAAEEGNARIYIPSGAVGGFDVLRTISLIAEANDWDIKAGIHTHKGPDSLRNTPLYADELQDKEQSVFSGSTKEAIALLPTKVNVAVASALATIGPENATAEITSVPKFIGDDHCITVETDGLKAVVDIYSANSDIAAWSVVALMRNLSSTMMFF